MDNNEAIAEARRAFHFAANDFSNFPGLAAKERLEAARARLIALTGEDTRGAIKLPWMLGVTVPRF